jgi:predicted transcriptional regulator YdeE
MSKSFDLITLDMKYLAMAMADTKENALSILNLFLQEHALSNAEHFEFQFRISQGGQKHILYLSYAVIPEQLKAKSPMQVVKLNSNLYMHFTITHHEYNQVLDGEYKNIYDEFLKAHDLSLDMSSIFGLFKENQEGYDVYIPCKKK